MSIPKEILTAFIAMMPLAELRGAIPVAIGIYHLHPLSALFWAVLGNIIPIFFILAAFERLADPLTKRFSLLNRFLNWLFERTRRKHSASFERWGALALIIFVAIPLPMTGAWSGAVAAFVFGIPYKKALLYIFTGVFLAGLIVTAISLGVVNLGGLNAIILPQR